MASYGKVSLRRGDIIRNQDILSILEDAEYNVRNGRIASMQDTFDYLCDSLLK